MNGIAYEVITARIIALLEQGTVPWHRPWDASTEWPQNLFGKNRYGGVNVFVLLALNYKSPFWLTYRQAIGLGGQVRKGEKACPVVFWKILEITNRKTGEVEAVPYLRYYFVFNVAQCDGLDEVTSPKAPALETVGTQ